MHRVLAEPMAEQDFRDFSDDASAFVNAALLRIHSVFGKLVFLANLEGSNYRAALARERPDIEAAFEKKHREMFTAWLGLGLATQTEEVAEYFARKAGAQNSPIAQSLQRWIRERLYEKLIPETASDQESRLFSIDLRAVLQLLEIRIGFRRPDVR